MDYRSESPPILRDFLIYHETIKAHSKKTVDEYFLDLRMFFRFLKMKRGLVSPSAELDGISIMDVDADFIRKVSLTEVYDYLSFLSRDRIKHPNSSSESYGLTATSRARKIATIRSYFKYLTVKVNILTENPLQNLDSPKLSKTLPRFLSLEESRRLLMSVDGAHKERDYCIICIFLNCGLRISEIVGLNITDIRDDHLRIHGKGDKERVVYINDAVAKAINDYLSIRKNIAAYDRNAFFLSARRKRISTDTIQSMLKKNFLKAGLDASKYSAHKLRHTAATLMLQNGVDVRTLQEILGHEHLNTTQIYTHVECSELRNASVANPLSKFDPNKTKTAD